MKFNLFNYKHKNEFYIKNFQLVPLIHGIELLDRIRDNYIIIEVYSRQNSEADNLLGIAKLPVHQLYIAYRDPLILPHLLLSKVIIINLIFIRFHIFEINDIKSIYFLSSIL